MKSNIIDSDQAVQRLENWADTDGRQLKILFSYYPRPMETGPWYSIHQSQRYVIYMPYALFLFSVQLFLHPANPWIHPPMI